MTSIKLCLQTPTFDNVLEQLEGVVEGEHTHIFNVFKVCKTDLVTFRQLEHLRQRCHEYLPQDFTAFQDGNQSFSISSAYTPILNVASTFGGVLVRPSKIERLSLSLSILVARTLANLLALQIYPSQIRLESLRYDFISGTVVFQDVNDFIEKKMSETDQAYAWSLCLLNLLRDATPEEARASVWFSWAHEALRVGKIPALESNSVTVDPLKDELPMLRALCGQCTGKSNADVRVSALILHRLIPNVSLSDARKTYPHMIRILEDAELFTRAGSLLS